MNNIEKLFENHETEILYLKMRIKEIEESIKIYHELVLGACPIDIEKEIRKNMNGKIPYKCPVCNGSGKTKDKLVCEPYDQQIKILVNPPCDACEGKCIVWG